jgi:hypothetical protein
VTRISTFARYEVPRGPASSTGQLGAIVAEPLRAWANAQKSGSLSPSHVRTDTH